MALPHRNINAVQSRPAYSAFGGDCLIWSLIPFVTIVTLALFFVSLFLFGRKASEKIFVIGKLSIKLARLHWKNKDKLYLNGKEKLVLNDIKNNFMQWINSTNALFTLLLLGIFLLGLNFESRLMTSHNNFTKTFSFLWVISALVGIAVILYNLARNKSIERIYAFLIPLSVATSAVGLFFGKEPPSNIELSAVVVIISIVVIAPLLSVIKPRLIPQALLIPLCILLFEGFLFLIFGSYYIRIIEPNLWATIQEPNIYKLLLRVISYGAKCMFTLPEIGIGKPLMPFAAYLIGLILNLVILTFFISIAAGRAMMAEPEPSFMPSKMPLIDQLSALIHRFENDQNPSESDRDKS